MLFYGLKTIILQINAHSTFFMSSTHMAHSGYLRILGPQGYSQNLEGLWRKGRDTGPQAPRHCSFLLQRKIKRVPDPSLRVPGYCLCILL